MSGVKRYRKRPVVVEAMRVERPWKRVAEWCGARLVTGEASRVVWLLLDPLVDDTHRADIGDWIIRDVRGEFYPCKPDIFEATYEEITDGR